jgi:hypothetical protein
VVLPHRRLGRLVHALAGGLDHRVRADETKKSLQIGFTAKAAKRAKKNEKEAQAFWAFVSSR